MTPKPTPGSSASIWEQWLQRLSPGPTKVDAAIESNRFELLDLLSRNVAATPQFFARLGTILSHSLYAEALIVYEQTNGQLRLIFSTLNRPQERELLRLTNLTELPLNRLSSKKIAKGLNLKKDQPPIRHLTQMPLQSTPTSEIKVAVLSEDALLKVDLKFLNFITAMMRIRHRQLQLGHALNSETERLATLTHHLSEGLMILDRDLKVTLWNRPLQRLTGYSPREAERRSYAELLERPNHPLWLDELREEYQKTPLRNVFYADFEIRTKQKQKRWVSVSGSFLRNSDDAIEQTIVIVRDISRNKELEDRKSEFISIATHELRTPITAIKGYLSLLQKDSKGLSEKQKMYLSRALEANDRLVRLAEDLLQVTHVEENRLQFSLRPINVLPITRKVMTDFTAKAKKKGLQISLVNPTFPTTIAADPIRLEQVLANLVDNAIKYTRQGRIELSFSEVTDRLTDERQVAIHIKDTGIGLNERELQHIFDKFHRSHSAQVSSEPGAGLGLFIVKSFIEKQAGQITVKSKPNRGSTFTVLFPVVEAKALGRRTHERKESLAR